MPQSVRLSGAEPLVSVILPAYNAGNGPLCLAVQSILRQTYTHLELIVVDDGSTDGSIGWLDRLRDDRLKVIQQANGGRSSAMNRGLSMASGEFWVAQDADDISHPRRVERLIKCLMIHPDLAAAFTGHDLIIGSHIVAPRTGGKSSEECRRDIEAFRMPAHGPTPMFRTSLTGDLDFDTSLGPAEDLDYILRVGERFPVAVLGECLYSYRVDTNSVSRVNPVRSREMERKAVELACRRRGLDPAGHLPPARDPRENHLHRHREQVVPHFMESVLDARRGGHCWRSLQTAFACARLHPADLYYYKPLAYALTPLGLVAAYRQAKENGRPGVPAPMEAARG